jgi:hypothetical protein
MSDPQSQTPSTHYAPFDTQLKMTLRLNRDRWLLFARVTEYQDARRSQHPSYSPA